MSFQPESTALTRRSLVGLAGAAAMTTLLASCSSGGASGGANGKLKFWNMPWGTPAFNTADAALTASYKPASKLPSFTYQTIQWSNFTQDFAAAIASGSGPAVSSGGGLQAFQYAAQNKIAYADDLVATMKQDGTYDDFLPGTFDAMKTPDGYAAVPYGLDVRVLFYRKSLFDKAGVSVPTDWPGVITAAKALKKIGVFGWAANSGAGAYVGEQGLFSLMINNGGGLFNADGEPDVVTDRNIEAMELIRELASLGAIDPNAPGYTNDNLFAQWNSGKYGYGFWAPGFVDSLDASLKEDVLVAEPLKAPHGDMGTAYYPNNLMMYADSKSPEGASAFLLWYVKNMHVLWDKGLMTMLPALKSIAESATFKANANSVKVIEAWQPIAKTYAAPGGTALYANLSLVDGTAPAHAFSQSMLAGRTDAKKALQTFQAALDANSK